MSGFWREEFVCVIFTLRLIDLLIYDECNIKAHCARGQQRSLGSQAHLAYLFLASDDMFIFINEGVHMVKMEVVVGVR